MEKKNRDVNMDLLRILAMLLVVTSHCIQHSEIMQNPNISYINTLGIELLHIIGLMCNSCFILITGYYLIGSKFKIKKVLSLWGITLAYSIIIYFIGKETIGVNGNRFASFFPIINRTYWFITTYIILYFLSPIINLLINNMTKKQYKYLLIVTTIIYGIIRAVFTTYVVGIQDAMYVYFIGAYIRKYVIIKKEKEYYLLKCITAILIIGILKLLIHQSLCYIEVGVVGNFLQKLYTGLEQFTNIFIIFATICLFMKFKTIQINNNIIGKVVNLVSPSLLSVYIIHEHPNIRDYIWQNIFNFGKYANSWVLIIYMIFAIILIFIMCILIDLIRRGVYKALKKIPIIQSIIEKINEKLLFVDEKINS